MPRRERDQCVDIVTSALRESIQNLQLLLLLLKYISNENGGARKY